MENEKKQEIEIAEEENTNSDADMSDDDIAASLGYITSLTEMGMTPPGEPTDLQGGTEQESGDEMQEDTEIERGDIEGETDGTPEKDKMQDDRIAQIEAELQKLLQEENQDEPETENTEPA